jgi:hypothetical protein
VYDKLIRSEQPIRRASYAGRPVRLGRLEAAYLDLLWRNRGYLIDNEWAYRALWPELNRLDLIDGNRLSMLASTINKKLPRIIETRYGLGRYIPNGSGITMQRTGAREVVLFVKPALQGTPVEEPMTLNS